MSEWTFEGLLGQLKRLLIESKDFYPDDDSMNAGYREALRDIIKVVEAEVNDTDNTIKTPVE